ncbi:MULTISPECIES: single-stranded DNA-binding protein [Weeksella]|uniref:Single-stranded DNA-binding protein n=1 Tax=Weeksella virosa (strain ATCC 43766 / DSM 16922 / JCM 21250 / CCUG 30538 / CDC 9751 / IAM 14551 / NBRC 16016 / NCTC 11634 / CL345/78) TaxID=865938 RepID=F0P2C4_WEEVC|nr:MULTISPECIES: single-stranded DNA-binding protein [Weeksella]ADX66736.1 single-strand binding protein [Weeksella virosa DSM 16922]MDK7675174.1 single-stranded DNA-binding protein [Weeksella virosa]OFM85413.1 single-stranded DNA-binding protein [Weeksella sp. HMSC059D05]SUP52979.1 Helix-destabilizing protein [Weeksella virosa]VEH63542.1 Helix-destabilizing protein [Weeksella virosa]
MKSLRNKVQLIGHVGNTPEVKQMANNRKMAKFSLATNDSYTNQQGEKITQTEWHSLVVWGKLAEVVEQHVTKGKELVIEGKLTYNSYEDANGVKRTNAEIIVHELLLL